MPTTITLATPGTIANAETVVQANHILEHKNIGAIRGTFKVAKYQRGYRWDVEDVRRLLDDIWEFKGADYSLQPVVVKKIKDGEWELIDGQQRLTTLYLIFTYMQKMGWKKMGAPYSIHYETRPGSGDYLKTLTVEDHNENIDYFHLYKAYNCISNWLIKYGDETDQEAVANEFHSNLFKHVRVIWFQADTEDSTELFTRLNVGRIPLTDAELIKALLLSGAPKISCDRAQEIAAQWDGIEQDLHNPDIWAFIAGAEAVKDAEKYPTRISLLLDVLADAKVPPKEPRPRYHSFDTLREAIEANPKKFWEQVVRLHALILGWFGESGIYNKIGFLVASKPEMFGEIVKLSHQKRKTVFDCKLTEFIRKKIGISKSSLMELSYEKNPKKILEILLLMNVEAVSRTGQRFPFWRHLGTTWSLEHIHAQNAAKLNTGEQWKTWLEVHNRALKTLPVEHEALSKEIDAALLKVESPSFGRIFDSLAQKIIAAFEAPDIGTSHHEMHSITNLALLSSGDNSALSNSVFEVKRQKILEIDRNEGCNHDGYIPICTRNVFLKYYAGADEQQMYLWGPKDRESYQVAITTSLKKYFLLETQNEEES